MNVFLTILGILVSMIVVIVVLAIIAPKSYSLKRSIVIESPKAALFDYLRSLRNQDHYSKWAMLDLNKKMTFEGEDGVEGSSAAWDSRVKQAGKGKQTLSKIIDGERIEINIVFIRPFAGVADTVITTTSVTPEATSVDWAISSKMAFPMNAMLLFLNMDKMLGKDVEISLSNLKQLFEKNKAIRN